MMDALSLIRFRGNDVILFHVLDPAEIDFTFDTAASFEDLESGEQLPVIPDALREQYRAMVKRAHRGADEQGQRAARRLQPAEYRRAARLRALQLHVDPRSTEPDPLMSFLAPLFFAGLAALAVPVLIHLIQRERKNVVPFPSLMFVRQDPVLVDPPPAHSQLGAARCCGWPALALIVAAFARPFLRSQTLVAAAERRARRRHPARPVLQHGPRRSVGSRARAPRPRRPAGWSTAIAARWSCSRRRAEVAVQPTNDRGAAAVGDQRRDAVGRARRATVRR